MIPLAIAVAFGVALAFTWWLTRPGAWLAVVDVPNERSLHVTPRPRGGGLAVLAGVIAGSLFVLSPLASDLRVAVIALCAAAVAAISYADDRAHVSARWRLGVHLAASAMAIYAAGVMPAALALPGVSADAGRVVVGLVALLGTVWLTNLYNFMDGMDGYAGTMGVMGFGTLAIMAWSTAPALAAAAALVAAACAGFLVWNFPPASIFMGDVGASTLGFMAAMLILLGDASGAFPWWLGALAFAVFVADASITLARRAWNRERVWQAHRSHFYQRLVALGWSHRATLIVNLVQMCLCSALALTAQDGTALLQWTALAAAAFVLLAPMAAITWVERARNRALTI